MAAPPDTLSLVPAQGSSGGTFAQQGTIDWTSLGQMQFSSSVAILSRLAGAGIEPLTVAVAQTVCSRIPIGSHGEMVLTTALNNLKSFSSAADLVYFGVGVRHVLRTLVQTSQGAASVALCAALAEGHSISAAALIMYEMTKLSGCDQELTPSFAQWEAFVKVCSCVFASTNFGLRLQTLIQLRNKSEENQTDAGHPADIARVLLALGNVTRSCVKKIDVSGGVSCCWIAVFAELILGLRVSVHSSSGQILTRNFDDNVEEPQVCLRSGTSNAADDISCVGQVYTIPAGSTLIYDNLLGTNNFPCSFPGGRVKWSNMISEVFDDIASPFVGNDEGFYIYSSLNVEGKAIREAFAEVLVSMAAQILRSSEACRYQTRMAFYECIWRFIPEVQASKRETIAADHANRMRLGSSHGTREVFIKGLSTLKRYCGCISHAEETPQNISMHLIGVSQCLADFSQYLVILGQLLGYLSIQNAETLYPTIEGLKVIYKHFIGTDYDYFSSPPISVRLPSQHGSRVHYQRQGSYLCALPTIFKYVITLFSGYYPDSLADRVSAVTDGRVYCYVNTLVGLSDRLEVASQIQVGVGSIQAKLKQYPCVLDIAYDYMSQALNIGLRPHNCSIKNESLLNVCWTDTTSPKLASVPLVEESVHLVFWYRISSELGHIEVSPAELVRYLYNANEYRAERARLEEMIGSREDISIKFRCSTQAAKAKPRTPANVVGDEAENKSMGIKQNQPFTVRVIEGESFHFVDMCPKCLRHRTDFTIIPCHGNVLGRVAALIHAIRRGGSFHDREFSLNVTLAPNKDRVQQLLEIWDFYRRRVPGLEEVSVSSHMKAFPELTKSEAADEIRCSRLYRNILLIT